MAEFNKELLDYLSVITPEEEHILAGEKFIDKSIYSSDKGFIIDNRKVTDKKSLISIRPHTRFIDFPLHGHNYIEVVYVIKGSLVNIIDSKKVLVNEGEILFLNQHLKHATLKAGLDDIAVNFIILPEFFDVAYSLLNNNNVISNFLINILRKDENKGEYLLLKVSEILPIQNLIENMCYSLINKRASEEYSNQITMALLFTYLTPHISAIENVKKRQFKEIMIDAVLQYININYSHATLSEIANELNQSTSSLSRLIKLKTNKTFKELLQSKRFYKALQLLQDTDLTINEIILAVGYENSSYFYRRFKEKYSLTPNEYRLLHK